LGLVCCKGSYAQRGVEREGGKEGREKGMGSGAGRGKFKGKPTGRRHFSTPEEMAAGTSDKPLSFKRDAKEEEQNDEDESEEEEESEDESLKKKGTQGVIEVENPNLVKIKNLKVKDVDVSATSIHTHLCAWMSLLLHVECFLGSYQKLRQNIKNCSD
jgi:hypothetical protein